MISEALFLIAIVWLQRRLGAFLKNRTTTYYAQKSISLIVLGLNCFVIFSFAWFYGTKRERFQISNPQGEFQTLSEFKMNMVHLMKELSARMQQYLGLNGHDQCGSIGAVHYKFWDARIDSDHHERSKTIISAIDKVLKLEDGQWLRETFCVQLNKDGKYDGHLRISSHSICYGTCLPSDMQVVYDVDSGALQAN